LPELAFISFFQLGESISDRLTRASKPKHRPANFGWAFQFLGNVGHGATLGMGGAWQIVLVSVIGEKPQLSISRWCDRRRSSLAFFALAGWKPPPPELLMTAPFYLYLFSRRSNENAAGQSRTTRIKQRLRVNAPVVSTFNSAVALVLLTAAYNFARFIQVFDFVTFISLKCATNLGYAPRGCFFGPLDSVERPQNVAQRFSRRPQLPLP